MNGNLRRLVFVKLLMTTGLANSVAAQGPSVTLGAKGGFDFARQSGVDADVGTRQSITFGVVVSAPLGRTFALQAEVMYARKGADFNIFGQDNTGRLVEVTDTWGLDYIEIPTLLKATLLPGASFAPVLFGGPALAFHTDCGISQVARFFDPFTGEFLGETRQSFECFGVAFKDVDLGILMGAGVDVPLGRTVILSLEGRYDIGLLTVLDSDVSGQGIRNRTFSLLAGLAFRIGGSRGSLPPPRTLGFTSPRVVNESGRRN